MLEIITEKKQLDRLHKEIRKKLLKYTDKKQPNVIGFKSNNVKRTISISQKYKIWWTRNSEITGNNRYWNLFGKLIGSTVPKNLSIVCQINFPFILNRAVGGVLAKDKNKLFVLHRGKIGGGRQGIGKTLFMDHYKGRMVKIDQEEFALVGEVTSSRFCRKLAEFIYEVDRIKNLGRR